MSDKEILKIKNELTNKWCDTQDILLDKVLNVIEELRYRNKKAIECISVLKNEFDEDDEMQIELEKPIKILKGDSNE